MQYLTGQLVFPAIALGPILKSEDTKMPHNESSLGFFLLAVLIGFAVLIYILLKHRKSWLKENLLITADQIWETISERAEKLNLKKSELLFAISQDATATTVCLVVKDAKNH